MPLFWKPYKSEITQFLDEMKKQRPTLEAEQRAGRGLLWDKPIDWDFEAESETGKVPQQPYVYQTKV